MNRACCYLFKVWLWFYFSQTKCTEMCCYFSCDRYWKEHPLTIQVVEGEIPHEHLLLPFLKSGYQLVVAAAVLSW